MPLPDDTGIPVLTTGRLRLRPPGLADIPGYLDLMMSERARFMGGPYTKIAAWGWFCHERALWQLYGHGGLMIELNGSEETIGLVGINDGPLFAEKELGWMLYDGYEGHGYATEAAAAMRDWAFAELGLRTLVSYVDAANAASAAVAERLGGVRDDTAPRSDPDDLVFRHTPPN